MAEHHVALPDALFKVAVIAAGGIACQRQIIDADIKQQPGQPAIVDVLRRQLHAIGQRHHQRAHRQGVVEDLLVLELAAHQPAEGLGVAPHRGKDVAHHRLDLAHIERLAEPRGDEGLAEFFLGLFGDGGSGFNFLRHGDGLGRGELRCGALLDVPDAGGTGRGWCWGRRRGGARVGADRSLPRAVSMMTARRRLERIAPSFSASSIRNLAFQNGWSNQPPSNLWTNMPSSSSETAICFNMRSAPAPEWPREGAASLDLCDWLLRPPANHLGSGKPVA